MKEPSEAQAFDGYYILSKIKVHKDNPYFCDIDGVLYSKNKKILWYYPGNRKETICTVPYGVTELKLAAFANSNNRKAIILPPTITKIGSWFGFSSNALKSVLIKQCALKITFDKSYLFQYTDLTESIIQYEDSCVTTVVIKTNGCSCRRSIHSYSLIILVCLYREGKI